MLQHPSGHFQEPLNVVSGRRAIQVPLEVLRTLTIVHINTMKWSSPRRTRQYCNELSGKTHLTKAREEGKPAPWNSPFCSFDAGNGAPRQLAAGSWKMRTKKTRCLLAILVVPWLGRSPGRVAAGEKVESAISVAPAWSAI